jgi:serine/threonine protein kinase
MPACRSTARDAGTPARTPAMPAATSTTTVAQRTLGRFELQRKLGQGAQATVWLAHDARLDRDVALKLLTSPDPAGDLGEWLHEARAVSRMTHPHIVPVFDADVQEAQRYLVFEYVPGPTLSQHLRERGALPPREAVMLMLGVLDALHAAHSAGIVHRDLKPSNILLDAQGRARVMDFGIAARIASARDSRICGTPGYMSPEAARGEAPTPAMDVFAAGMLFGLMLTGTPLLREPDPMRAIARVIEEDLGLPTATGHAGAPLDDTLHALVRRAIARDPAQRMPSAREFHHALSAWLQPAAQTGGDAGASGTLEFLLRRMRHKSDFPGLSDSVSRIQRLSQSDSENLGNLTNEILKDVALTHKLLRMVNSAHYGSGGPVTTVSRAVSMVGMAAVGNMAISLILLDRMQNQVHAAQLKEEFLRALMAGTLAQELSANSIEGEKAFLGALFQNLGRLLTEYYFPEEAQQIRALMHGGPSGPPGAVQTDQDGAALRVLGIRFDELGQGVARSWGMPESLQKVMRRPRDDPSPQPVQDETERRRCLGGAANAVADALLEADDPAARITAIAQRNAKTLGLSAKELLAATEHARQRLSAVAAAMNLRLPPASPASRLLAPPTVAAEVAGTLPPGPAPALKSGGTGVDGFEATFVEPAAATDRSDVLAAGIQDISSQMVVEPFQLNVVLRMVLETMYRGLGLQRVVFCLRDARTDTLTGRFGLGEAADKVSAAFRVPLRLPPGAAPDLFTAVCAKGADTLIADASAMAQRLPPWYGREVAAPAFLLLPMMLKGATFGLLYADCAGRDGLRLQEKELTLLRTLRNQAVMAFKQSA